MHMMFLQIFSVLCTLYFPFALIITTGGIIHAGIESAKNDSLDPIDVITPFFFVAIAWPIILVVVCVFGPFIGLFHVTKFLAQKFQR